MSNYGKRSDFLDNTIEPQGAGCTILCSSLCKNAAISLCKCKNAKEANKGSTFYEKRNYQVAIHREPTSA